MIFRLAFALSSLGTLFLWAHNRQIFRSANNTSLCRDFQSRNNPPTVKIIEPKNNSTHRINSLVRYSITVSDPEEGESKFDEIPADKIFLEIILMKGQAAAWNADKSFARKEPAGLTLIKNWDCFSCHGFHARIAGPSFHEIAERYSNPGWEREDALRRIREGSQGAWGDSTMPAHPDVTAEEARKIVDWIRENGLNTNLNYLPGKEGSFRLTVQRGFERGFFVLHASYTDNGSRGRTVDGMTGEDFVIIGYR